MFFTVNVHMPKDRITQSHQGYGFVEFLGEEDADYSIKIMNMIKLYGKPIRVNKVKYRRQMFHAYDLLFTRSSWFSHGVGNAGDLAWDGWALL